MRAEKRIDYIEIPVTDPAQAQSFFEALFGWEFRSWGDDYVSFSDGRLDGGFARSAEPALGKGALLVFFSENLERDLERVVELGAAISKEVFSFPGGRRFHFVDPTGTEYAIWSEVPDEPSE